MHIYAYMKKSVDSARPTSLGWEAFHYICSGAALMPSRRAFLKSACIATTVSASSSTLLHALPDETSKSTTERGAQSLRFDSSVPVVQTSNGPVRGYIRNGVHTFKGIPYGASTAGGNRFRPPQKPEPWSQVYDAVAYGYACLQVHGDDWKNPVSHFVMDFDAGMMSENCLSLNVWT